jgi:Na+-translocating ferredoxin:NAD+ oxidoreductase subunit B
MKTETEIYRKLASHLDSLPGGYPSTESGVELRILRRLFSLDDAELAVHVSLIPEEARVIARRAGISREEAANRLEAMSRKGLVYELPSKQGGAPQYAAAQFVIGIWEFSLNRLDTELIRDVEEYMPALMEEVWKVPQLRTIPIGRSLDPQLTVLPYESAEEIVRKAKKWFVMPCICRRERHMVGAGCNAPEEACLVFDMGAEIFARNGLGRFIDRQEALDILARADEAGLVLQPGNSKNPMNICCCCGCCCGVLRNIKTVPKPAAMVSSPFTAAIHAESCASCGTCVDRCQMDALRLDTGPVELDPDRCIGCGLCVSTCPTGSLKLVRKPESEQPEVPKDGIRTALKLGQARGKISPAGLAWLVLKSKVDRLRALRD